MKSKSPILILGAGGHALACIGVLEAEGKHRIVGLLGKPEEIGKKIFGHKVIGTDNDLPTLLKACQNVLVAIGQIKDPVPRQTAYRKADSLGARFPVIRSPFSHVSPKAVLGEGTIAMPGVIVQAGSVVGKNCILNSRCLLEHGVQVGDHCHLSTGSILNGDVKVGAGSFVGSGTVVQEGTVIRANSVVPMGTIIRRH